ncbi:MAG TPA: molybdenum ABC transporter ATP-binding protein [Myxococcota bacterium]|nr:molybdenum ABC transporter ATP-binding protein [Myxococcota bacterium]
MSRETLVRARVERGGFALDVELKTEARVAVLFGPSGSGKTTLFETLLGLHAASRPTVQLAGRWLDDPTRGLGTRVEARGLGWVPQEPMLFPHLDVAGNLRFGMPRAGGGGARALADAIEVLELGPLLARRVDQLSGGERSRVALGRALASGPQALLLDEPLASLDLALRARVLPYLLRVRDSLDLPIFYITHDPDEAQLVGEWVAVLDRGRVVACGEPRAVLWSRAVLPLSESLGLENVIEARVRACADGTARVATRSGVELSVPAPAPLAEGESVRLGLPARDVLLAAEAPGRISARNVLMARVVKVEPTEGGALVHVDAGLPLVARLTQEAVHALELAPGRAVYCVIKAHSLRRLA